MSRFKFSVIIEKDKDGYYAFAQELDGCYTQGGTYEEVFSLLFRHSPFVDQKQFEFLLSLWQSFAQVPTGSPLMQQ